MAIIKLHNHTISGGGLTVVKLSRQEYELDKNRWDKTNCLIEITDDEYYPLPRVDNENPNVIALGVQGEDAAHLFDRTRLQQMESNISTNEDDIVEINTSIDTINEDLEYIKGILGGNEVAGEETLVTKVNNNTSSISNINTAIGADNIPTSIKGRIKNLEENPVGSGDANMDEVNQAIANAAALSYGENIFNKSNALSKLLYYPFNSSISKINIKDFSTSEDLERDGFKFINSSYSDAYILLKYISSSNSYSVEVKNYSIVNSQKKRVSMGVNYVPLTRAFNLEGNENYTLTIKEPTFSSDVDISFSLLICELDQLVSDITVIKNLISNVDGSELTFNGIYPEITKPVVINGGQEELSVYSFYVLVNINVKNYTDYYSSLDFAIQLEEGHLSHLYSPGSIQDIFNKKNIIEVTSTQYVNNKDTYDTDENNIYIIKDQSAAADIEYKNTTIGAYIESLESKINALSNKGSVIDGTWITRSVPVNSSTKVATLTLDPTKKYLVIVNGEWVEEYEVYQSVAATADGDRILLHNGLMKYGKFSMSTVVSGKTNIELYGYVEASSGTLHLAARTTLQAIEL